MTLAIARTGAQRDGAGAFFALLGASKVDQDQGGSSCCRSFCGIDPVATWRLRVSAAQCRHHLGAAQERKEQHVPPRGPGRTWRYHLFRPQLSDQIGPHWCYWSQQLGVDQSVACFGVRGVAPLTGRAAPGPDG